MSTEGEHGEPNVNDGELVGFLTYQRKGLGDKEGTSGIPPPEYPPTTDWECITAWDRRKVDIGERMGGQEGKYVLGDIMGVNPM